MLPIRHVPWGQTWPSLALSWAEQDTWAQLGVTCAELGPVGPNLGPTWAQLEPNWGPTWCNLCTFGRKLGVACATWSCVGHLVPKLGPRQHEPPSKPNNIGNSSKNAHFQRAALSPQNWLGLGPTWPRAAPKRPAWVEGALSWIQLKFKLAPIGHVGLQLGPKRSRWIPNSMHVMHMEVQVESNMPQLHTRSLLQTKRHR